VVHSGMTSVVLSSAAKVPRPGRSRRLLEGGTRPEDGLQRHLLRYRTAEAKAVLEEAAKGEGMIPFCAQQALKRREEGTWAFDPG
jgi:hypothetical protein